MANSMDFDGTDLSAYNLVINSPNINAFGQLVSRVQLQDRGYSFRPQRAPRKIRVEFTVTGTSRSNLEDNLDSIKRIIIQLTPQPIIFDVIEDRYFNAILESFTGDYISPTTFRGSFTFICPDPVAHSTTENDVTQNVDADPKTLYIPESAAAVVGGSAFLLPTFVLTAGETLSSVTLLLKNETTIEEISISSLSLVATDIVTIDSSLWTVTRETVAHMANVTGKFPRLEPNLRNKFTVTAFGTLGTLEVIYREAYL